MILVKKYIEDNREWFKLVVQLFIVSALLGAITYFLKPDLINLIIELFKDKFGVAPAQDLHLAQEIFTQNLTACLIALLGGLILGITPFLIVIFNGFIIGFVVMSLFLIPGNPLFNLIYIILGLVPHGIFEIPAFFVAAAVGMRFGTEWLSSASAGRRGFVLRENLRRAVLAIPVTAVLLAIAALVEVFVSGQLVNNF